MLLLDVVAPVVAYQGLHVAGVAVVAALALASVFPAFGVTLGWVCRRRMDGVGVLVLLLIAVGAVSTLLTGSARFALVKESFFTGLLGSLYLGSLLAPRPLTFYFGRRFRAGDDEAAIAHWNGLWRYDSFRRANRLMTVVWGVVLIVEAGVRVALVFALPVGVIQAVSAPLALVVIALLVIWTVRYGARVQRRALRDRGEHGTTAPPVGGLASG